MPVVDDGRRLVGVVLPSAIEEAVNKRKTKTFLRLSGIIGGEEFRTMPLLYRSWRRLSWLSMNIVLNIIAASVIVLSCIRKPLRQPLPWRFFFPWSAT